MTQNYTETETWTIEDLISAITDAHNKKNKIEIPKFQRTLVWSKEQKKSFIDSIKNGFPIGALLLFKSFSTANAITVYSLIDGLQRSSTLNQYYKRPTQFFDKENIHPNSIKPVINFVKSKNANLEEDEIIKEIVDWIVNLEGFNERKGFSSFIISNHLDQKFSLLLEKGEITNFYNLFVPILGTIQKEADISKFNIPILIYNGEQNNLPIIFERLNSKGTQLSKYQIYAATWSTYNTILISNRDIIENIKKKYDRLIEEGYEVENYDGNPRTFYTSQFSYFEYLFGLGKLLCQKYEYLFKDSSKVEQEDSIGFNLVNICLELPFSEMENIPRKLLNYNLNELETALLDSVEITYGFLKGFVALKMNKIKRIAINHSEFQIVSLIGKVFHSKYNNDLSLKLTWPETSEKLKNNIPYHYLYDIIREHWKGSGDSKAFSLISSNRYENTIPKNTWLNVFEEWFNTELEKKEKVRVNVNDKAILFFKYLYTYSLSAYEEISNKQFDIEHLIPVDRLKEKAIEINGLPISAFPNLCLLDSALNREKGSDTFYEHFDKLIEKSEFTFEQVNNQIENIEKYSHTNRAELEFVLSDLTKDNFELFLRNRYDKLIELFFRYNNIE